MSKTTFPKILYIGCVPFEESFGSNILLYRLFKDYPTDQLFIISSKKYKSTGQKLVGVNQVFIEDKLWLGQFNLPYFGISFLQKLSEFIESIKSLFFLYKIKKLTKSFQPDIILTLTMSYHWYIAYQVAKSYNLPLNTILHDRWEPNTEPIIRKFISKRFQEVLQFSKNCFFISPTMEQFYYKQTGAEGTVLYPIGTEKSLKIESTSRTDNTLTAVYFGSIWQNQPTLIDLAHELNKVGGRLVIFSNRTLNFFQENGLKTTNVEAKKMIENKALLTWCKTNADFFYLPMYFDEQEKEMVQCSFPSKIVDYTSLSLPVLIQAPEISSVVKFARANADLPFGEVVPTDNYEDLEQAINKLQDEIYRENLGNNGLKIWKKYFAPEVVKSIFFNNLKND